MIIALSQLIGSLVTLSSRHDEVPGVESFEFAAPGVRWEAGQYFVYMMPSAITDRRTMFRPFTAAGAPGHALQITTRIGSQLSPFKAALTRLHAGDKVLVFGPYGRFTFDPSRPHSVFLVGGIGVTPVRAILDDLAARSAGASIDILYASRPDEIIFRDKLARAAARLPNVQIHLLSDGQRLDASTIKQIVPGIASATCYITGPKPMVKGVGSALRGLGLPSSQIKRDALKGYPWGS
jgi:ferredoxin-NADP reductase